MSLFEPRILQTSRAENGRKALIEQALSREGGEAQFIAEPYVPNPCECAPPKDSHGTP